MRIQIQINIALLVPGLLLTSLTGCRKKAALAPPAPPPAIEQPAQPPEPKAPAASLSAEPASIEPGQAVTLKWSTADAADVIISELGAVAPEGTKEVRPAQSTTYELVATGPGGSINVSATVNVAARPLPVLAAPDVVPLSFQQRLEQVSDAFFEYDKSEIRGDARAVLAKDAEALRAILADFPSVVIVLEGHCDERGSAEYNIGLGAQRVASASAYLEALGVQTSRLRTISYGKERPQCSDSTEECWQKNRRVHFSAGATPTN